MSYEELNINGWVVESPNEPPQNVSDEPMDSSLPVEVEEVFRAVRSEDRNDRVSVFKTLNERDDFFVVMRRRKVTGVDDEIVRFRQETMGGVMEEVAGICESFNRIFDSPESAAKRETELLKEKLERLSETEEVKKHAAGDAIDDAIDAVDRAIVDLQEGVERRVEEVQD